MQTVTQARLNLQADISLSQAHIKLLKAIVSVRKSASPKLLRQ